MTALAVALMPVNSAAQAILVEGLVLDQSTSVPLIAVEVRLQAPGAAATHQTVSGDRGEFTFEALAPGQYVVQATRVGYIPYADTVQIDSASRTVLEIMLVPDPVALDGLTAEAAARPRLDAMAGFWERRERYVGHFMTREDIEAVKPQRMSDLFRRVPGARIASIGQGQVALFARVRNADGRPCVPAVFLDGLPYAMTDRGLDDFAPINIEAIEVYTGSARIPARFNATGREQPRGRSDQIIGNPRCGVIVLWTRRGSASDP